MNEIELDFSLTEIFSSIKSNENYKTEDLIEFVYFGASLYELKARKLNYQEEDIEWYEEIELLKDRDVAFARLLQFKAFSEVGLAFGSKIKEVEKSVPAFKYYQVKEVLRPKEFDIKVDREEFIEVAEEVFNRYKTIKGYDHIDKDLPDLQKSIDDFVDRINNQLVSTFEDSIANLSNEQDIIAYFLALLETIKWGIITARQQNIDEDIMIEKNE